MTVLLSTSPSKAAGSAVPPEKSSNGVTVQESQVFPCQTSSSYTLDVLREVCDPKEQLSLIRCAWLLVGSRYMDTDDAVFAYSDASCDGRVVAMNIPIDNTITKAKFLAEAGDQIDHEIDSQLHGDPNSRVAPRNLLRVCPANPANRGNLEAFDLIVDIRLDKVASVWYTFNEDVFSTTQIERVHRQLSHILLQLQIQADATRIEDFQILNDGDKFEIDSWNQVSPKIQDDSFDSVLRRHVLARPQALAIDSWDGSFTYVELDQVSDKLARYLIRSESPGDLGKFIGICFEKSAFAVIAMIAIQKAGAAYVILDPSHPPDRLASIISATHTTTVISSQRQSNHIGQLVSTVITVDLSFLSQLPQDATALPPISPSSAAYIQFTSGSTGQPKGAVIQHQSLCSVCGAHAFWKLGPDTRFLQFASYVFAASVVEIFNTLYYGGCICIPLAESQKDRLLQCIQDWRINTALMTPTGAGLLHPDQLPGLKTLLLGGEAVTKMISSRWAGKVTLFVGYGASEATFGMTGRQIFEDSKIPEDIGKGINVRCWVVDPQNHDQLLPVGCVGELLVEGPGLSTGYLNDPEKTAKSFIENPKFLAADAGDPDPPRRLWKTGDLVRCADHGNFIYIGRKDTQAKWNGVRIDLSEVAHCFKLSLNGLHTVVAEMISPAQLQGRSLLTVFVSLDETATGNQSNFAAEQLLLPTTSKFQTKMADAKIKLQSKVPHYMVPQLYVQVSRIPTNISGKTDRKTLRSLGSTFSPALIASYGLSVVKESAPLSATERLLQNGWADVLNMPTEIIGNGNFFQLGGDSVTAMHLVARMQRDGFSLTVAGCFGHPQLSSMASIMEQHQDIDLLAQKDPEPFTLLPQNGTSDFSGIKAHFSDRYAIDEKQIDDLYPCTPMQESLMALTMQNPRTYICQNVISLPEEIDSQRLQKSWELTFQEVPILRATLVDSNEHGSLVMILARELVWNNRSDLHEYLQEDKTIQMLYGDNLSRFAFIKSSNGERHLVWTWHHAILDGWALYQVLSRVMNIYNDTSLSKPPSFTRFSRYLLQCDKESARNFWHSELADARSNHFPQTLPSSQGSSAHTNSSIELVSQTSFQAQGDFTMSTVLQAAWAMVVAAYSGTNDVVFGVVSAGRHAPISGIQDIIGPTIATIPLRVRLETHLTVSKLLGQLQIQNASSMTHEHFGLQNIAKLGESYAQLCQFQNLLVIQPAASDITTLQGINLLPSLQHMSYDYPLIMECQLGIRSVKFRAQFDNTILSHDFVQRVTHHMAYTTEQLVSSQLDMVKDINIFSPRDETQISTWMQSATVPRQVNQCVHDIIRERTLEDPRAEAICAWDGTFTYGVLEKWSTVYARQLLALGLKPGTYVPICFEKSRWAIIAMLALMKCGAAYVVLDSSHPIQRLQSIVKSVDATIIITSQQNRNHVENLAATTITFEASQLTQAPMSDDMFFSGVSPLSPVVIQFTSGSTGSPKGIVIEHAALCSSSAAHASFYGVGRNTRMFNFAAFAFDVSVADIWTTLMHGGCVCIPRDDDRYNNASKAMRELDANMSFLTPSVATLLDPKETPLKKLILGGERVTYGLVEKWADSVDLIACYGPAETCIYSSATLPLTKDSNPASIGKPFGCRYWIADVADINRLAPVGCVGELCIEGPILAKEYLNDPLKTAASFIENPPWAKGKADESPRRFYRTGDLVRYASDGSVIFVARKDTQVKVSGQRVELAEIEHGLFTFKDVKIAAVLLPDSGIFKSKLVAIMVLNGPTSEETPAALQLSSISNNDLPNTILRLRKHLSSTLTPYMVPSFFAVVEAMPHNSSGKIDKNKLQAWLENANDETRQMIISQAVTKNSNAPLTATEQKLRKLCAEVLKMGVEQISMNQDFISIGGDSISAIRLVMLARSAGLELKVKDIITSPSILDLCAHAVNVDAVQEENMMQDGGSHGSNAFSITVGQELIHEVCRNSSGLKNEWSSYHSLLALLSQEQATMDSRAALDALVEIHPVLRSRFEVGLEGHLLQTIDQSPQAGYRFSEHHVEDAAAVRRWFEDHAPDLDITNGPVFAVNMLTTTSGDQYLDFIAHDLVADEGSWDILVGDFFVLLQGGSLKPSQTPQYQSWARFMTRLGPRVVNTAYSNADASLSQYWDIPEKYNPVSEWTEHSFTLDRQVRAALGASTRLFNTEIDDLLIAGLLHSFTLEHGSGNSPALLTGFDGRRISSVGLDMSRTIGCFDMPMVFRPQIESTSSYLETTRRIKDIRCQCLQHGHQSTTLSAPSSGKCDFSFRSEIQQGDSAYSDRKLAKRTWESSYAPFNAVVYSNDGNLEFVFKIDSGLNGFENADKWLASYKTLLTAMSLEMPNLSPRPTLASYPLLALTYDELDKIYSEILPHFGVRSADDVEDIYPCSPVQEGMLITRSMSSSRFYEAASILEVSNTEEGTIIDPDELQNAWRSVMRHHPMLRTVFFESLSSTHFFDQAVLNCAKDNTVKITCSEEQVLEVLQKPGVCHENDIQSTHKLTICQTPSGRIFIKLELLHTCYDGHSTQLILRDLSAAYGGILSVASPFPYSRYVNHLQNVSTAEDLEFWAGYLKGIQPCHLKLAPKLDKENTTLSTVPVILPDTKQLLNRAREQGLTVASLIKTAWSLVLRAYTHSDDVCFGFVASGRDTPVDGIGEGVGPYIKQLTCRSKFEGSAKLSDLMRSVQSESFDSIAHQNAPLLEIQHKLGLSGAALFNTNMSLVHVNLADLGYGSLTYDYISLSDPAEYDITVRIEVYKDDLDILLSYWNGAMSEEMASEVSHSFGEILSYLYENATSTVQDISDHLLAKGDQMPLSSTVVLDGSSDDTQPRNPQSVSNGVNDTTSALPTLRSLIASVLQLEEATLSDDINFFAYGGDSLTAMHLIVKAREQGINMTMADILHATSLSDLSRFTNNKPDQRRLNPWWHRKD